MPFRNAPTFSTSDSKIERHAYFQYAIQKCPHVFRGQTTRNHLAEWNICLYYEHMNFRKAPAFSRTNDLQREYKCIFSASMHFRKLAPAFFTHKRLETTWQNGIYFISMSICTSEKHPRFRGETTRNESMNAYFQYLCTCEVHPRFSRTNDSRSPRRMGYISLV